MDAILEETTLSRRQGRLEVIPNGLDLKVFCDAALERIKEQDGQKTKLGMAALMWLSHSERPLHPDELSHALAVEIGSTDLDTERITSVDTMLDCCLGLVVIDKEASAIRLIHGTLQEYFYACPDIFGPTHSIMAETCLTYLNFRAIKDISPTLSTPPQSTPFLNYSSLYWGVHARREASRDVVSLALQIFSQIESHISTRLLMADLISKTGLDRRDISKYRSLIGFTGLHCASIFGIAEVATALMDQPYHDLNGRDILGITPLIWATICGQEEVAKLLLERPTVNPDKPDRDFGRTALSWAANKGQGGIVRLLLEWATAKPDVTDHWWGKTPRVLNKVRGRRYVNPNWLDKYGHTPVFLAAGEGHEGVVELLLGRKDVKSKIPDSYYGLTLLGCAARNGHEGVVKILLERDDVSPDKPDRSGRTPLFWAAQNGHEGVVRTLLERDDVSPDKQDNNGQTPLWSAARNGHEGVVKKLVEREDVSPDKPDRGGRTPLFWAAQNGHDGVVKILLERDDVSPNNPDDYGQTPLCRAAHEGHAGVVKILLERDDVSPDKPDDYGQTPLHRAAQNGHEGVVKILLKRDGVSPNKPDHDGQTPLCWAARNGHEGVARTLLKWEDVGPYTRDNRRRIPFRYAVQYGHAGVAALLQPRGQM